MVKKLTRHGNSLALVIDKSILELLKIDNDTPLELTTDGKALIIEPLRDSDRQERLQESIEAINKKYERTLQNLAK